MRTTHTYALLKVSAATYSEISRLIHAAAQEERISLDRRGQELIDLHGIALQRDEAVRAPYYATGPDGATACPSSDIIDLRLRLAHRMMGDGDGRE